MERLGYITRQVQGRGFEEVDGYKFCKPLLKRRHKVEDIFEELKGGSPIAGNKLLEKKLPFT